jgi:hypothetical protein
VTLISERCRVDSILTSLTFEVEGICIVLFGVEVTQSHM